MSSLVISSFIWTLLLLSRCGLHECLNCYQCDDVRHVTECKHVATCSTDESCFTDTTGAGDNTRFTLGCRPTTVCRQSNSGPQSSLIGRAVSHDLVCSQCCGVDLCNQHICSSGVYGLHTSKCEDDPNFNCAQVSSLFNVCSDKDHAKLVCRKFCGLCDIVDGYWLEWTNWATCSQTCGNGTLSRTRACNRTVGGLPCTGDSFESQPCYNNPCPVNGGWTQWSNWSGCSVTCGVGLQSRERNCSNPFPGPGGHHCTGNSLDDRVCSTSSCTDGIWLEWSAWSTCSASCQGGLSKRFRQCDTKLSLFGHSCVGNNEEYQICNTQTCGGGVVYGAWTSWSSWSKCSPYCTTERTRMCSNPVNSTSGHTCIGSTDETKVCNIEYCSHPVRLVNGSDLYEGRLEVFHNGEWGTIYLDAIDQFTESELVKVVCRMLNYVGIPKLFSSSVFGRGSLPAYMDRISCTGKESDVFNCTHSMWSPAHYDDKYEPEVVSLTCHADLDVYLINGSSKSNGRLKISIRHAHLVVGGSICNFDKNVAEVACRMLSLPTTRIALLGAHYGKARYEQPLIDEMYCNGSETNLGQCRNSGWGGAGYCYSGMACVNKTQIRLVNGTNQFNGRVEASFDGIGWGTVCDTLFDRNAAIVTCRMLGYPTNAPIHYASSHFGSGPLDIVIGPMECAGDEEDLLDCPFYESDISCDMEGWSQVAGVWCSDKLHVRLVNGTNKYNGRLEVSADGNNWGVVEGRAMDNEVAKLVCRTLGYPTDSVIFDVGSQFGYGSLPVLLSGVECDGDVADIGECELYGPGGYWKPGRGVAAIHCINASDSHVRLVNGSTQNNGRLEMSLDGSNWYAVCNGIDHTTARTVCRMLGYPTNTVVTYYDDHFGHGSLPVFSNDISCDNNETSLGYCDIRPARNSCYNNLTSGILCDDSKDIQVRLVDKKSPHSGRVEVSFNGTHWGSVCGSYTFEHNGPIVCKMLGLPSSNATTWHTRRINNQGLFLSVTCRGSESSLMECPQTVWSDSYCIYGKGMLTCA